MATPTSILMNVETERQRAQDALLARYRVRQSRPRQGQVGVRPDPFAIPRPDMTSPKAPRSIVATLNGQAAETALGPQMSPTDRIGSSALTPPKIGQRTAGIFREGGIAYGEEEMGLAPEQRRPLTLAELSQRQASWDLEALGRSQVAVAPKKKRRTLLGDFEQDGA